MNNGIAAAMVILVLVAGAGAGYLVGVSGERTVTVQTNTTNTATQTTCTTLGPTNGVALRVIANNGSWAGVKVTGEAVGYCNNFREVVTLGPVKTNATGWVSFLEYGLSGIYYLHVNESVYWTYDLSIVTQPLTTTYAILNLSTGNVTTHFCYMSHFGCETSAG
jgi:hypothetical protein